MWLIMGQYFASNFTFFFALTWLFPHIKSEYNLNTVEAGFLTALPLIAGAFGNWTSGFIIDALYKRGKWKVSRVLPSVIGFSLGAIGLVSSIYMDAAIPAVLFLSLAVFGTDMTIPTSWTFCVDIGKRHAGVVSGTMNMAGNIGSFVTGLAFPYLYAWTGSVEPFFFIGAGLNVVAIILWLQTNPEKSIDGK